MQRNDHVDVAGVVDIAIPIDDLEHPCSSITLRSTKVFVHVLAVKKSTLQGELNHLCGYEARCIVDNDNVAVRFMWTVYTVSMGLVSSEVFQHLNVEIVLTFVGIGG